jgi:endonuclease III
MPELVRKEREVRLHNLERELKKLFPGAGMALTYSTHWELLVAVMLSAQCTDKKVNEVTRTLFVKYPTLEAYVHADPREFEKDIHATGFFRSKTKHVLATAKKVHEEFGGELPRTMREMLTLPGVARKTANVVLGNAFGIVEGIAVDTHVKRFAIRFDLTDHTDPKRIECDLMSIVPQEDWFLFTYRVIEYGRQIAPARKYDTSKDPLVAIYPPAGKVFRV